MNEEKDENGNMVIKVFCDVTNKEVTFHQTEIDEIDFYFLNSLE